MTASLPDSYTLPATVLVTELHHSMGHYCVGRRTCRWDHPRSRGEHSRRLSRHCRSVGSSPLARGARSDLLNMGVIPRIIPARAGSTPRLRLAAGATEDHPRSRGEHAEAVVLGSGHAGSSPLARGALCASMMSSLLVGIIPARAGSTLSQ